MSNTTYLQMTHMEEAQAGKVVTYNANLDTIDLQAISALEISLGDGTNVIAVGSKVRVYCPYAFAILGVTMGADQSGSVVVDIWKDTHANYPPTNADSITASAKPTISAATKSQDNTLTGWTKTVDADTWLFFNVDSCSTITQVTLALKINRT
jgi:hypothetical protein